MNNDKLLTINEAADFLSLSPYVVRDYCNRGTLKAHKVGEGKNTRWRIWEKDLYDFVNNSRGGK
jgi:excisionase family DNA binding protein